MILLLVTTFLSSIQIRASEPVSVNFDAIKACDLKLADPQLKSEVSLNLFKDVVDRQYPTLNQKLIEREVFMKGSDQLEKRLKIVGFPGKLKWQTEVSIYRVNKKGEFELLPVQPRVRKNPQASDLKPLFSNHQILSDRVQYEDQKNNSVRMEWTRVNQEIMDLKIWFPLRKLQLSCQKFKDGLTICTCSKI